METLKEQLAGKIESKNIREYEMNIVLEDLCIKRWNRQPYSMDEIEENNPIDEPLGQYTEERLKEYTDENFRVEFEYCCGYYGSAKEPLLIQVEKIYKDEKLYMFTYHVWLVYGTSGVVENGRTYCMDEEDHERRLEKFYESME